jgi:hypothetical protein
VHDSGVVIFGMARVTRSPLLPPTTGPHTSAAEVNAAVTAIDTAATPCAYALLMGGPAAHKHPFTAAGWGSGSRLRVAPVPMFPAVGALGLVGGSSASGLVTGAMTGAASRWSSSVQQAGGPGGSIGNLGTLHHYDGAVVAASASASASVLRHKSPRSSQAASANATTMTGAPASKAGWPAAPAAVSPPSREALKVRSVG